MRIDILPTKILFIFSMPLLLSACLGGTIAQQIARSIATDMLDKTVARALDVDEKPNSNTYQNPLLVNKAPDPYRDAMMNMQFTQVTAIQEQLPQYPIETEVQPTLSLQANPLVQVELFNWLGNDEKIAMLEQAKLKGALNLPNVEEWKNWRVATGVLQLNANKPSNHYQEMITFLVPPDLGKLPSGSLTMVEISNAGDLNIARYQAQ